MHSTLSFLYVYVCTCTRTCNSVIHSVMSIYYARVNGNINNPNERKTMINAHYVSITEHYKQQINAAEGVYTCNATRSLGGITRKRKPSNAELASLKSEVCAQFGVAWDNVEINVEPIKTHEHNCLNGPIAMAFRRMAA